MSFYFFFIIINFIVINTNLNVSFEIISVNDCIEKIFLNESNTLYTKDTNCRCNSNIKCIDKTESISYEIGQKINIDVYDLGGGGGINAKVKLNNYGISISTKDKQFWGCNNCLINIFPDF